MYAAASGPHQSWGALTQPAEERVKAEVELGPGRMREDAEPGVLSLHLRLGTESVSGKKGCRVEGEIQAREWGPGRRGLGGRSLVGRVSRGQGL